MKSNDRHRFPSGHKGRGKQTNDKENKNNSSPALWVQAGLQVLIHYVNGHRALHWHLTCSSLRENMSLEDIFFYTDDF